MAKKWEHKKCECKRPREVEQCAGCLLLICKCGGVIRLSVKP